MGALVGALVGPLVGPLVDPLVGPLVGRGSLSPVLCVVQYGLTGNFGHLPLREEKTITHHAFFRKIFRKIGQKSKQQKTHISVAKCVRCFKEPARLRLARPISCIFSVGRVHHESLHGGVRKILTFHRKIASIFHRKMVCVFLSAAGKLVNIFHRKNCPFSSHVV